MTFAIHPLTPDRQADFLAYFEGDAFADNPKWSSCYCQFLYVDHNVVDWHKRTAAENKAQACERIAGCRMQGYLAYRDGKVIGWCNAAPRGMLDAFADEPDPDAARIGQVTCFVVAKAHRRTGVAKALLEAACAGLKAQGLAIAEACPKAGAESDADNHFGPRSLYESAGFSVHRLGDDGLVIMRRPLA
jgi:GNAT superfamily N-acetyltransferase